MLIESIPLWGSFSVLGVSLALNLFLLTQLIRGELATRREMDQVQKTADTFQHAWEIEKQSNEGLVEALNKVVVGMDTVQRMLEAAPPHMHEPGDVT